MAAYPAWQYSRWVKNISRNSRQTLPTGAEKAAYVTFLKLIWNPVTQTGTRPWLQAAFQRKSIASASNNDYKCNLDVEPNYVLVELLEVVGRDLKKIALTDTEAGYVNTLITATGVRRLGTGTKFGSVGGEVNT